MIHISLKIDLNYCKKYSSSKLIIEKHKITLKSHLLNKPSTSRLDGDIKITIR